MSTPHQPVVIFVADFLRWLFSSFSFVQRFARCTNYWEIQRVRVLLFRWTYHILNLNIWVVRTRHCYLFEINKINFKFLSCILSKRFELTSRPLRAIFPLVVFIRGFSLVQFSLLTSGVVRETWQTVQQKLSSSRVCMRPLRAVLAWAGMSILWCNSRLKMPKKDDFFDCLPNVCILASSAVYITLIWQAISHNVQKRSKWTCWIHCRFFSSSFFLSFFLFFFFFLNDGNLNWTEKLTEKSGRRWRQQRKNWLSSSART